MTKLHVLRPAIATPFTRAVCREWQLQCNLTGCRYNLRHDTESDTGTKGAPPAPVPLSTIVRYRSCALNIAEEIPAPGDVVEVDRVRPRPSIATKRVKHTVAVRTLADVADLLGVTRQAVEKVEARALRKLLRESAAIRAYRESDGQSDRAGASLPGGMEDE